MTEGIVPAVLVQRTVLYRAYRVFPLVTVGKLGALNDAAAREAEYARMHVEQGLCQILAHAVLAPFPSIGGEEADVLYIGRGDGVFAILAQEDAESAFGLGTW